MGLTSVRHWPILLKNSFSTDDGKILGVIRREARFRLGGGYMKELMSRCRTSWAACEAKLGQFFDCLDIRQDFAAPAIWSFSTESAVCSHWKQRSSSGHAPTNGLQGDARRAARGRQLASRSW